MKPRYTRQRTQSDCGPVAILNILKWAGLRATYDSSIEYIKNMARYKHDEDFSGTHQWDLRRALNRMSRGRLKTKTIPVVHLDQLTKHVSSGGAFILYHSINEHDAHYTTVVEGEDGKFDWINMGPKTVVSVTPEEFEKRVMSTQRLHDQVVALLIKKTPKLCQSQYS